MLTRGADAAASGRISALPRRQIAVPGLAIAALAAAAWAVTIAQARRMGNGPGTMGLTLLPFLGLWVVMMAAMMLASVAPVAVLWLRVIGAAAGWRLRLARSGLFLVGYLLAWSACGIVAYAAAASAGSLLAASPAAAKWLGVSIFVSAGVYQLTSWKNRCLRHCRSPMGTLLHYLGFSGRCRDVRVGLRHGAACVGCCWGLMVVLIAVGVMNLAAMAALGAVIFTEKNWRYGKPFGTAVGLLLIASGIAAIWLPWLLPGLHVAQMQPM